MAYEPVPEQLDIENIEMLRPMSTTTTSESTKTRSASRSRSKGSSRVASPTLRGLTRKPRSLADKWRSIKREMMANLKAARLKTDRDMARSEMRLYVASTPGETGTTPVTSGVLTLPCHI